MLSYLSRYTHRVAISNSRLVSMDEHGVTFRWKDYRAKGRTRHKTMILDANEFMRRFLLHVLPGSFHRIRHYGLLSNGSPTVNLARSRALLGASSSTSEIELPCPDAGREDVERKGAPLKPAFICWHCGAAMIIVQTFAQGQSIRAPPQQACTP